jgi:hypothetical protein
VRLFAAHHVSLPRERYCPSFGPWLSNFRYPTDWVPGGNFEREQPFICAYITANKLVLYVAALVLAACIVLTMETAEIRGTLSQLRDAAGVLVNASSPLVVSLTCARLLFQPGAYDPIQHPRVRTDQPPHSNIIAASPLAIICLIRAGC